MDGVAMFLYRLAMAVFPCMPPPPSKQAMSANDEREAADLNADLLTSAPTPSQANTPIPYAVSHVSETGDSAHSSPDIQVVPLARFQELERELEKQREVSRVFREAWQRLQDDVNRMSEATPSPSPLTLRPRTATGTEGFTPATLSPTLTSHALQTSLCSISAEATENHDAASVASLTPTNGPHNTPRALAMLSPLTPVLVEDEEGEEGPRTGSPSAHWVSSTVDKPATIVERSPLCDVTPQPSLVSKWNHMEQQVASASRRTPPASIFLVDNGGDENAAPAVAGVPNTVSKYQENKHVRVHDTPFPVRVDRALQVEQARREGSHPVGAEH